MKGIKVIYTPKQFKEKGFDGEIAKYMRENKNTAIVGGNCGIDRHVISFTDNEAWKKYSENNPYKNQDTMSKRKLQIDVMGHESNFENIRKDELIRCKLYVDGRSCVFWTTESNYNALVHDRFFIRDGKDVDCSGAINTTNDFIEDE